MRSVLAVTLAAVVVLADPLGLLITQAPQTTFAVVAVASAAIVALMVRWYRHP